MPNMTIHITTGKAMPLPLPEVDSARTVQMRAVRGVVHVWQWYRGHSVLMATIGGVMPASGVVEFIGSGTIAVNGSRGAVCRVTIRPKTNFRKVCTKKTRFIIEHRNA